MSSGPPNPPQSANDAQVEAAVREVLAPLNRTLSWMDSVMGFGLFLGGYVTWRVFRQALDFAWWSSALLALLAVVVVLALWAWLGGRKVRRAVAEFDRRFPPGSAGRDLALQVLSEMESPSKAERKLQEALGVTPPEPEPQPEDQIVRHRRVQPAGQPAAPPPDPPPGPPPHKGYYDYIPLELPAQEPKQEGPPAAAPPAPPAKGPGGER